MKTLEALKAYFYEHAYPTWQQFHDVLDSFRHKNDKLPITDVDGLADQLNGKASSTEVNSGRIASANINENGYLILTLNDSTQLDAGMARGIDGDDGKGIVSFEKTSTVGLVDTYTITYTDDSTTELYIVNGANGTNGSSTETLGYALSDQESNIAVGVKIKDTINYNCTLVSILLSLSEAPTGSSFQVNVKLNDISIFSTKITIDANEVDNLTAATQYALVTTPTIFAVGDRLEISIDAVGGLTTGKGAIIKFKLIKT